MNAMPAIALRESGDEVPLHRPRITKKGKKVKLYNLLPRKSEKSDLLSREEQEAMILEYRLKARSLAHSILRRWHSRIDSQEVESVVDLSLCEAVRRYNRKKGASFITFLFYHLRGNLIRAVSAAASVNYVPLPDFDGLDSGAETGSGSRGRLMNAIEIADTFCHRDYTSPDEMLLKKEVAKLSTDACSKLDPLEREVIYRIFVLEQQLMDIAENLGYSRCHISRVKRKALEALHSDLAPLVHPDGGAAKPNFDDADELPKKGINRRKIHRRKPRSKKPQYSNDDLTEHAW
jgi:RNA polymerase sigma factor (sigma-70 family)